MRECKVMKVAIAAEVAESNVELSDPDGVSFHVRYYTRTYSSSLQRIGPDLLIILRRTVISHHALQKLHSLLRHCKPLALDLRIALSRIRSVSRRPAKPLITLFVQLFRRKTHV